MLVQIYEVSTPEQAKELSELGVDHIGVLVGNGSFPRELSVDQAKVVCDAIGKGSKVSVLSLSSDLEHIRGIIRVLRPEVIHLGATSELLLPTQVLLIKNEFPEIQIMRSIPVTNEESIEIAKSYDGIADFLLLDSHDSGAAAIGALGVTHSWDLDRKIVESVQAKVIIAGGLGPENVAEAIRKVHPFGVDSKTKTDITDGSHKKDIEKVREFINIAKGIQ
jgi:phosphoribosylanthranilate isomerase